MGETSIILAVPRQMIDKGEADVVKRVSLILAVVLVVAMVMPVALAKAQVPLDFWSHWQMPFRPVSLAA